MISEIVLPELGATGGGIRVVEWLVEVGDTVETGQPIFSVETDKALVEVEAFRSGFLRQILVGPDTQVAPGTPVALLADSMDEDLAQTPETPAQPVVERETRPAGESRAAVRPAGERILASPLARVVAGKLGVDLARVNGTGLEGRIRKCDVEKAAALLPSKSAPESQAGIVPLSPMRKAIAERTCLSKTQIPHFYVSAEIDMGSVQEHRLRAVELAIERNWARPTITTFMVRAACMALREVPQLNASYQGDTIRCYDDIHIGLVVGLPGGMMVPVIRHADQQDIYTLAATMHQLQTRTEAGELSSAELAGSTLTISNLGMHGIDAFIAVINPPEAAILALSAIRSRPAVFNDQVVPRPLMNATMSADHRVVDGIEAARFLGAFKKLLENPHRLVVQTPGP